MGMPAVARGNKDRINVVAGKEFPEIGIEHTIAVAVEFIDEHLALITTATLHIGQGDALHVRQLEHPTEDIAATGAAADDSQGNLFAGCNGGLLPQGLARHQQGNGKTCGRRQGVLHELAACGLVEAFHDR